MYEIHIVRSLIFRKPVELKHIPETLMNSAKRHKVLYALGFYDSRIHGTDIWCELDKRNKVHEEVMVNISELANKLGIRLLIVKTLKFPGYIPDDIDILVIDDPKPLIEELLKRGYFIRKIGTPEITLRTYVNNLYVDLDVHRRMAAGTYEYIDKYYLWSRRIYRKVMDVEVPTPNKIDELLITAAHAVLKELQITLSDIVHYMYHIVHTSCFVRSVIRQAHTLGLGKPVSLLTHLSKSLLRSALLDKDVLELKFPVKVPPQSLLGGYIENIKFRVCRQGLRPLSEFFRFPSSKGISRLLEYIKPW